MITTAEITSEKKTNLPSTSTGIPPMIAFSSNPLKSFAKLVEVSKMSDGAKARADELIGKSIKNGR
jgi:hypothetical protein